MTKSDITITHHSKFFLLLLVVFTTVKVHGFGALSAHYGRRSSGLSETAGESRREILSKVACLSFLLTTKAEPANANLMQFPCKNGLRNTYHFMRAGESLSEEQNILLTNPMFLTSREAALSDHGIDQVLEACRMMEQNDVNPSVVTYSIAAKSYDTASIISRELKIGNNRMMPEYTNLDPRGAGKWDGLELNSTEAAIFALDASEAGVMGKVGYFP